MPKYEVYLFIKPFFVLTFFLSIVGKIKDTPLKQIFNVINLVN